MKNRKTHSRRQKRSCKNKKGGYTVKNNFYIKTDCKNNEFYDSMHPKDLCMQKLVQKN